MELIKQHIESCLNNFIGDGELDFNIFSKIDNYPKKNRFKKLLIYLNKLIEINSSQDLNEVKVLHIHFENEFDKELELIIFQLIIIKLFILYQSNEINIGNVTGENTNLSNKIEELQGKYNILDGRCPEGASAKNGGNRSYKNWVASKTEVRCLLTFYKSLNSSSIFSKKALINCKVGIKNEMLNIFKLEPLTIDINSGDIDLAYNVINTDYSLYDIDTRNNFLDNIEDLILFDCENKRIMSNFTIEEIIKLNTDYGTNFKRFLVITFGNEVNSFQKVKDKIERVKEKFKIANYYSYTILSSEIDILLRKKVKYLAIEFIGFEASSFWDAFLLETKVYGLYELRSFKMMNVYALCYNEEIKDYILNNIFLNDYNYNLITEETKEDIFGLPELDIQNIKSCLSSTLDAIVNSNLRSRITENLANEYKIVVDNPILKNTELLNLVQKGINVRSNRKFVTWDVFDEINCEQIIILSYRDQGNFNHHFYPNINEIKVPENTNLRCILPAILFKHSYEWSKYNLVKDYHKMLDHPIRGNNFKWNELKRKIYELKPEKSTDISWDLESAYSSSDTRVTYRITFLDNTRITCNPSDLIIYQVVGLNKARIQTIRWIYENIDIEESSIEAKKLDLLIDDFNPVERLVDTKQQNNDLGIIRNQFGFDKESAGQLWKILLARKVTEIGKDKVYEGLKNIFLRQSISIVSFNHFDSTWINPDTESLLPRGNKVFKALCDYLELPLTYRQIIYTIKNRTINGKRNATRIYSKLLKDLFNDACFDLESNPERLLTDRLEYYKNNHNLDELGIDDDNPLSGLITLIELIIPELFYKKISKIEKIEQ